jgi:hypothetical protein
VGITLTPIAELNRQALEILTRELGAAEAMRFFSQLSSGKGNYTEERREMFKDYTLDDIRKGVEELRKKETRG